MTDHHHHHHQLLRQSKMSDSQASVGISNPISDSQQRRLDGVQSFTALSQRDSISPENEIKLRKLATELTTLRDQSLRKRKPTVLFDSVSTDPSLDPQDHRFDVYKWTRTVLAAATKEGVKFRRLGFTFKNLTVLGTRTQIKLQETVLSALLPSGLWNLFRRRKMLKRPILRGLQGFVRPGEMLLVLGRSGSGCSTLLKTISGNLNGLVISEDSSIHYSGIHRLEMAQSFKGEVVYNADVDHHFPHLTVEETLEFAAGCRTARNRVIANSRSENARRVTEVVMNIFGLASVKNTKVGNDYVRGVSGGERKRVSIAEMMLGLASIGCWDNSTRGLDAATALDFVKALRLCADIIGTTHVVAIYQASEDIFKTFDKVIVLYEGREIYFGSTNLAKTYFQNMGWHCPNRQTIPDFLVDVTDPRTRRASEGFEAQVPRSPEEFEQYWHQSAEYKAHQTDFESYETEVEHSDAQEQFRAARRAAQSKFTRPESPYMVNVLLQVRICLIRSWLILWHDKTPVMTAVLGQIIMALVVGSVFYGTPNNTNGLFAMGSALFFAVLLSALIAITEINGLYSQRRIIEKQSSYALYHPGIEALSGIILDIPIKILTAICFNITLYFLAGLRSGAAQFFIFFLFTLFTRFTMVALFRTVAAATKTVTQALAAAGVLVLVMVIYTGYTIPRPYMHPWFEWISWINPLAYTFEALMVNQMHAVEYPCEQLIPTSSDIVGQSFVCAVPGALAGQTTVLGDAYLQTSFEYSYSHLWRNLGILVSFWIFFLLTYIAATEFNVSTSHSIEELMFRRGHAPKYASKDGNTLIVSPSNVKEREDNKERTLSYPDCVFHWRNLCYEINIGGKGRLLLDDVSGLARSGSLTALMGVSGAGKTTLLDALAQRLSTGVSGDLFINGNPLGPHFRQQIGYVQQQDIHLETPTVREALRFSATLRQPKFTSKEKLYREVEDVIQMLNMEDFAEAVVGIPGEGLNAEQRKRLSIAVELAAKPDILLFLDEPTSGLDSQSSIAIVDILRKLADRGKAIIATIHQPSSMLFQTFDNLLFLAKGGRTVYFGEIGDNARTVLDYFERRGTRPCGESENPAEYLLEIVSSSTPSGSDMGLVDAWKSSAEKEALMVKESRIQLTGESGRRPTVGDEEFRVSWLTQLVWTTNRVFEYHWRSPTYVWAKISLGVLTALFIGLSFFESDDSLQGLQNVQFSIFMLLSILSPLAQQVMPRLVAQRSLFEIRERHCNTYPPSVFITANLIVELLYQIVIGIMVYASYYYLVFGLQSSDRQILVLLFCVEYFMFVSTFAYAIVIALPDSQTAGTVITLLFSMCMIFNGVFQPPQALPGFWIFMYRVNPLTYIVSGIAASGLHGRQVQCSQSEANKFNPPDGESCAQYLQSFMLEAPGQLLDLSAKQSCQYCSLKNADQYLASVGISWAQRWQNFGFVWAYISFNAFATYCLYFLVRTNLHCNLELRGLGKYFNRSKKLVNVG